MDFSQFLTDPGLTDFLRRLASLLATANAPRVTVCGRRPGDAVVPWAPPASAWRNGPINLLQLL